MFMLNESSIKTREFAVCIIYLWFYDFWEKQNKTKSSLVKEIYAMFRLFVVQSIQQ